MNKLLVLYVFHDYNDRVRHFINNAIFYDNNIDFIIISNTQEYNEELHLPLDNVKVMYRDNIGYDFGGWSEALLTNDLYKQYTHFIFANSSIIGPYIKNNVPYKWTNIYLRGLNNNNNIKLFGSTINANYLDDRTLKYAHVQSYIFSMNIQTLAYLIQTHIFSITHYAETFQNAIDQKEVKMSRLIIENGWNIGCLLPMYYNVDFTFKTKQPKDYQNMFYGDIMYPQHRNVLWDEYHLVFIKNNRCLIKNK
jgi:hypothetical protein